MLIGLCFLLLLLLCSANIKIGPCIYVYLYKPLITGEIIRRGNSPNPLMLKRLKDTVREEEGEEVGYCL